MINKYNQIFFPEYIYGAMENVGFVTINEAYCFKNKPTQRSLSQKNNHNFTWFISYVVWWYDYYEMVG